jgi:uncharacterized delta-60 repeat protein
MSNVSRLRISPTPSNTATITPSLTPTITTCPYICFSGSGFDQPVSAAQFDIFDPTKIYASGQFNTHNGIFRRKITRFYSWGEPDLTFDSGTGTGIADVIRTFYQLQNTKLILGGNFTSYRGNTVRGICRINNDGTFDNTFVSGTGFTGDVLAIAEQSDGKLIVGGNFTQYSGVSVNRLCRLNPNGSLDTTFQPNITGTPVNVNKIVVNSDDSFYVGGRNVRVSGTNRYNIILFTSGGSYDSVSSFNTSGVGLTFGGEVSDMLITNSTQLLIAGQFSTYNGVSVPLGSIRLNQNGTRDTTYASGNFNNNTRRVKIQNDGKYVFTTFSGSYSGFTISGVARINPNGTFDPTLSGRTFLGNASELVALLIDNSNDIYVGGAFTSYGGVIVNNFVKMDTTGRILDCDPTPVSPTPSNSPTRTPTPSITTSPTITPTNTTTNTQTPSNTPTITQTQTPSITPSNTSTPTITQTNTQTQTPSSTIGTTPSNTPTNTETPSTTPTNTETPSNTPTNTETPLETPTQTSTPSETPPQDCVCYYFQNESGELSFVDWYSCENGFSSITLNPGQVVRRCVDTSLAFPTYTGGYTTLNPCSSITTCTTDGDCGTCT